MNFTLKIHAECEVDEPTRPALYALSADAQTAIRDLLMVHGYAPVGIAADVSPTALEVRPVTDYADFLHYDRRIT